MNLRGAFPRARFWASVIVGLAYVLALFYVGGHYPYLAGLAQLSQLARSLSDFAGAAGGKCESNQWSAPGNRL